MKKKRERKTGTTTKIWRERFDKLKLKLKQPLALVYICLFFFLSFFQNCSPISIWNIPMPVRHWKATMESTISFTLCTQAWYLYHKEYVTDRINKTKRTKFIQRWSVIHIYTYIYGLMVNVRQWWESEYGFMHFLYIIAIVLTYMWCNNIYNWLDLLSVWILEWEQRFYSIHEKG